MNRPEASSPETLLQASGIVKRYPGTTALDAVDFTLRRGSVHVLIGENGAGKSTLVKILAGVEQPTSGRLDMDGREIRLASTRDADSHGIGIIYQELSLFPNLSVVENIFLGRERTRGRLLVDRAAQERIARSLLARLEQDIDIHTPVGSLPLGRQQIVEICRALARDVRVLLMDEPTSALSPGEIHILFRVIGELRASGVGIVYISHKLEELMAIGDEVTVLRDGRRVASAGMSAVDVSWIIENMTGRKWEPPESQQDGSGRPPLLEVSGLTVPGRVHGASFNIAAGEVVGIYGLMGAGRTELLEAVAGVRPASAGEIRLDGKRLDHLPVWDRIAHGVALSPEDRQRSGLVPTFSLGENMTLASLARHSRRGCLSALQEQSSAADLIARLHIKATGPAQPITALSGGNQQKAVIAKCLLTSPRVLLMDEPSRGVDVGARGEIFEIIRRLAAEGMAVVFSSSDLHEVLTLAGRVLVMAGGRITASLHRHQLTEQALVAAASAKPGVLHDRA